MILNFQLNYRPINIYWVFIDFFYLKNVNSSKIFWNILGKNKTKNINCCLCILVLESNFIQIQQLQVILALDFENFKSVVVGPRASGTH